MRMCAVWHSKWFCFQMNYMSHQMVNVRHIYEVLVPMKKKMNLLVSDAKNRMRMR